MMPFSFRFYAFVYDLWLCVCQVDSMCLTLCNTMDCSLPGSSIVGILQARTLEQVAISFSTCRVRVVSKSWRHMSRTQSSWQWAELHRLRQIFEINRTSMSISWMRSQKPQDSGRKIIDGKTDINFNFKVAISFLVSDSIHYYRFGMIPYKSLRLKGPVCPVPLYSK